jgi:hypothetical protein
VNPFTVQSKHFTLGTTYLCFLLIMIQITRMLLSAGQTETWYFGHDSYSTNCHEPRPMLLYFHRLRKGSFTQCVYINGKAIPVNRPWRPIEL